jgi:tRNA pseudouridine55 synthase
LTEGIILLDKPAGQTSFQSLGELKRRLGTGRVGHTGTLDRFAEGLLVALCGRMTRLCAFAASLDKEYVAVFTFGRGTDTLDPEGAVTGKGTVPLRGDVEEILASFRGTITQVPPAYSAVHVDGRRAYQAAREGAPVSIAARTVTIERLELLDFAAPEAVLRILCSKGTYIRSLARDMAEKLGTCAYVSKLRRTRVGGFRIENAKSPDAFDPATDILNPSVFFDAAPGLGRLRLKPEWIGPVSTGIPLTGHEFESVLDNDGIYGVFSPDGGLVAVVERQGGAWRYAATFPTCAGNTEKRPE